MNHLEGWMETHSKITSEYIKFIQQEEKKYEKSKPTYINSPLVSYQIEKEKQSIRQHHQKKYKALRRMFPNGVIHHQWINKTAKHDGVALVEGEAHRHNKIKIIKILEGKITKFKHEL